MTPKDVISGRREHGEAGRLLLIKMKDHGPGPVMLVSRTALTDRLFTLAPHDTGRLDDKTARVPPVPQALSMSAC